MKLRKNLAVITTVVMLSTITVPALAAGTGSESESWSSWFFSLFKSTDDSVPLSDTSKPER